MPHREKVCAAFGCLLVYVLYYYRLLSITYRCAYKTYKRVLSLVKLVRGYSPIVQLLRETRVYELDVNFHSAAPLGVGSSVISEIACITEVHRVLLA